MGTGNSTFHIVKDLISKRRFLGIPARRKFLFLKFHEKIKAPPKTLINTETYRKIKHSKDTRGFSNDSFDADGAAAAAAGEEAPSSTFRPTFSVASVGFRRGDPATLLPDGLRPSSFRVAGDRDLLSPVSRLNPLLPIGVRDRFDRPTSRTGVLLAGDGSDLLAGDFALLSILPPESPEYDRFLRIVAGDLFSFGLISTSSQPFSSLFSPIVVVEMVSLALQISENSDVSSALMKVGTFSSVFTPFPFSSSSSSFAKEGFVWMSGKEVLRVSGIAEAGFGWTSEMGLVGVSEVGITSFTVKFFRVSGTGKEGFCSIFGKGFFGVSEMGSTSFTVSSSSIRGGGCPLLGFPWGKWRLAEGEGISFFLLKQLPIFLEIRLGRLRFLGFLGFPKWDLERHCWVFFCRENGGDLVRTRDR